MRENVWAYAAPPTPATKPASRKPWSFTSGTATVKERAVSSPSRTATNSRPKPDRRMLQAKRNITTKTASMK